MPAGNVASRSLLASSLLRRPSVRASNTAATALRRKRRFHILKMPSQRLDAPAREGELPDQFLGIIGLQVEQRLLQQGKPGLLLRRQPRERLRLLPAWSAS